jgi:hypothetical protein
VAGEEDPAAGLAALAMGGHAGEELAQHRHAVVGEQRADLGEPGFAGPVALGLAPVFQQGQHGGVSQPGGVLSCHGTGDGVAVPDQAAHDPGRPVLCGLGQDALQVLA